MNAAALPLLAGGPPGWVLFGIVTAATVAVGVGVYVTSHSVENADEKAKERLGTDSATKECADCDENPCKHLERGMGSGPYRGGSHRGTSTPIGDGLDSHHIPPASSSPLPRADGPAIQMDPADHRRTASYGYGAAAQAYQAQQRALIASGNFSAAVANDVADARRVAALSGNPGKYDQAIAEMEAYAACLKATGKVI